MAASEDRRDPLLEVAEKIADGTPVSWEDRSADSPALASRLEKLRLVEAFARAFRQAAGDASGGPDARPVPPSTGGTDIVLWGLLRILEKLGEGGFGEVYRAHDLLLDRPVALKLRREDREESDRKYIEEARRLARIHHPNVLLIHGADVRDGRVGLWTELIEGETLEERLTREGPLGAAEALAVGLDLCRALAAIHAGGVLHGDVKTSNVMRERGGRIVLMDFGTAGEVAAGGEEAVTSGTPLVLAPEVLEGGRRTPAADIYSLGVLLFRLVTGRYPVEGDSVAEISRRHAAAGPTLLRDSRPDLPVSFVRAVERALSPRPQDRYPTAGAMERALAEAAETERAPPLSAAARLLATWLGGLLAGVFAAAGLLVPR